MSKKTISKSFKIILAVLIIIAVAVGIFFLYDSPAQYVKDQNGDIYLDEHGEPILYYTDILGNTFEVEDDKRLYVAVPQFIDKQKTADSSLRSEWYYKITVKNSAFTKLQRRCNFIF